MRANQVLRPRQRNLASFGTPIHHGDTASEAGQKRMAQHGRDVLLLERDTFPRFKIGESFMPMTYWPLKRIGMLEQMKRSRFVKKRSVQFVSASGNESKHFYF